MLKRQWFTPSPGLAIPDPLNRKPVPAKGKWVNASDYWHRRVAEGGGVLSDQAPADAEDAAATSEAHD